jgi:adenylyltransferase/sulfurtransferase
MEVFVMIQSKDLQKKRASDAPKITAAHKDLSDAELETYSRQIVLQDIGYDGQVRLRNGRACIVGLGGLGALIALKLVGMGIGYLRLVDRDIVSRADLHRQYLYDVDVLGQPKVEIALQKLSRLNPGVKLEAFAESFNSITARELLDGVDVVLDGLDSIEARYLVNRTCNKLKIPYVFGGAIEAFGNVSTIVPEQTFCLECLMSGLRDEDQPKCGVVGVHPSILAMVTAVQVSEAVRLLMGQEPNLLGKLLCINLRELKFETIDLVRQESCAVCGASPTGTPEPLRDRFLEETCARDGRRNLFVSPKERIEIDLEQLRSILNKRGFQVRATSNFGLTFAQSRYVTTSVLRGGIMLVQASPKFEGNLGDEVLDTYKSLLVDGLGLSTAILPEM